MDRALLEQQLAELPLYVYVYIDPAKLELKTAAIANGIADYFLAINK